MSSAESEPAIRKATLQAIALLIGVAASVLTLLVYLANTNPLEIWTTALVAGIGWMALWLVRRGYITYMPHLIVYSVLTVASLNVLAFGSVRTAGSFLFVAAVAGAGILLGRAALIGSVVYSVASLGALTLAETRGWLHPPSFAVGTKVWLTHSAVLVVVAILVFYSRSRAKEAFARQMEELQRRKRTELERDRSTERFARIFRTSPSPMLAQSARNGSILDVNPAFERCYGYSRDQVLGHSDHFLWADAEQRKDYLERLFALRHVDQERVTGLRAGGSSFEALISSEMGNDPEDRLIITTVADVSAQTEALERLRRSEERFAKAFNFSPLKMTITRLSDGKFIEVNQARDPVQGLHRKELLGKTTLETGGWLSPAERQTFVERLQREGHLSGYETRMRHVDGQVIDAKMWAELIEIDGEDCVLSCFVNTTEEKRREAQLMELARGMAGQTAEGFFTALTTHMAQVLGADMCAVAELGRSGHLRTLAVWRDGAPAPDFSYSLADTPCGEALNQAELCVVPTQVDQQYARDQSLVDGGFKAYVGQRLTDDDGRVVGVLNARWRKPISLKPETCALIAIFASRANAELLRLQREREIQRLNATLEQRVRLRTAELEKLNAELDSFAYTVSHDLKSPLRAIDGFTRLLDEQLAGRLQPDERHLLDRVLASTARMSGLIADLLALARVSQAHLALQPVDLSALAHDILDQALSRYPGRQVERRIAPDLQTRCDPGLARVALENLLGNALKYTRRRGDTVIELGRNAADGSAAGQLFIRDNGVGFDMAYADKLFKPFQRLHMPSEFEGTGIGLATVRRIMERHGGQIRGHARPGEGATFHFTFDAVAPTLCPPQPVTT